MKNDNRLYVIKVAESALWAVHNGVPLNALQLVLGTCAVESNFGEYRQQLNSKVAQGICQIEKPTFEWLKERYYNKYPFIRPAQFFDLTYNDWLSFIFCRLRYMIVPTALPGVDNIHSIAQYWKRYYNTMEGAGKIEDFINKYNKYVML